MKLKNKSKITGWLEDGNLSEVLKELKKQLAGSPSEADFMPELTSLTMQLNTLERNKTKGVLTFEQETVATNQLHDEVQNFLRAIEEGEDKPPTGGQTPQPPKPPKSSGSSGWWWWVLFLGAAFGIWFVFFKKPALRSVVKVCTLNQMTNEHCCTDHLARISLMEMSGTLYVTAVFEGLSDLDPDVRCRMMWESEDDFPTQPIRLTMGEGDLCYSAMVEHLHGIPFIIGKFKMQFTVNGEVVAEQPFELIR